MPHSSYGLVILAGAGPGDPELITVKLQQRLAVADVIITDRLVNPLIVSQYARADARVIQAGKQGYNEASLQQQEVNQLILQYATAGTTVLRLKGGDVAFFSNVLDELLCLQQHGIRYEIIPGISAASGISAYAGIPLTARGYAQGVHLVTLNPNSSYSDTEWKQLATGADTLVCYMSAASLRHLVEQLLRHGADAEQLIAVVEQGTTPYQQVHISTLGTCLAQFSNKHFSSPSLILVGKVVELHAMFQWYQPIGEGSVFLPLERRYQ